MATYYGTGTWIGVGVEAVAWGTPAARTVWNEAISCDMKRTPEIVRVPHLVAVTTPLMPKAARKHTIKEDAGGSVEFLLRYRGMGLFLKSIFGAVVDAGAGPYTHTFTLGDPRTLVPLTYEIVRGDSGLSEVFAGGIPSKATLSFPAHDYARVRLDVIAKTAAARASAGTPTANDDVPVLGSHVGAFTWNSVPYTLRNLEITLDRKWARRSLLGSLYTAAPNPTDLGEVVVRATLDVEDAFYTANLAGTEADGSCTITDTTDSYALAIHHAYVRSVSDPISSHGNISQTVEFLCQSDGADHGISLVNTNPDATYDVN